MKIVRGGELRPIAWKNGRGTSRHLAVSPEAAGDDSFDWRVSCSEIAADSPFSQFADLDRQILLLRGRGFSLRCRDENVEFDRSVRQIDEPFAFRGEWETECTLLAGPVEVLNVMTRRGRFGARVAPLALDAMRLVAKAADEALVAYLVEGQATAYGRWGTATLDAGDAVVVDERERTEIALAPAGGGPARFIEVRLSRT